MRWRGAFLGQARSDDAVRRLLERPEVEYCHRLHYLQMVTEKLAKGLMASPSDPMPPLATHLIFVRLLQTIKGRREFRDFLGFSDWPQYRAFIDSLLPLANDVEQLAPSAAGFHAANPEYPWQNKSTGAIITPAEHHFSAYDPRAPRMLKLEKLLSRLLEYE